MNSGPHLLRQRQTDGRRAGGAATIARQDEETDQTKKIKNRKAITAYIHIYIHKYKKGHNTHLYKKKKTQKENKIKFLKTFFKRRSSQYDLESAHHL